MVVGRLAVGCTALALLTATVAACSGPDQAPPSGMTAGSAGAPVVAGSGGSGVGGNAAGAGGSGGVPHVPPMRLADDPTGITGLEDCALAANGVCVKALERSRAEVCQRWQADRPQVATSLQTQPTVECEPGTSLAASLEDALRRLNLYRWLGGAPPLALDAEWNEYARACAMIQSKIGPDISHYPEMSAPCFSEKGYAASGQSQLAFGMPNPSTAIDALIYDSGDNNFHILGHRQGMLMPWTSKVGLGFALPEVGGPATCVRTFDENPLTYGDGLAAVYTFPAPGYQPWEVIADSTYRESSPLEWSITLPYEADATNGKVRLLRLTGSTWEDVPVTSGPFLHEQLFGLWVNLGVGRLPPGTYSMIVTGTSVGDFGYQMRLEQCTEVPLACDVLSQNCGAGLGCYDPNKPYCRQSLGLPDGAPCTGWDNAECAPGLDCVPAYVTGVATCTPYCDPLNLASAKSCDVLCPGAAFKIYADATTVSGAQCMPGAGSECNPLAPLCAAGQTCQGFDPPACASVGTTAIGQECDLLGGKCVAGATCVGVQGSAKVFCQPYCDPLALTGANACATLCPLTFFDFDSYGICVPLE